MSKDEITYETIINRVKGKLNCGNGRISDVPAALRWSWWPIDPDFQDELFSDRGVPSGFEIAEKEFREEVQAIHEVLGELGYDPGLAKWQKIPLGPGQRMWRSLNRMAEALGIWDQIGMPIRRQGDTIYRIWSPKDVMGSPIIMSMPIDAFVYGVATRTASNCTETNRLRKLKETWQIVAIVSTIISTVAVIALFF